MIRNSFILVFILLLVARMAFSQYNIPTDVDLNYCSHLKSAYDHQKMYYSIMATHPMLEEYDVHFYFLDIRAENNTVDIAGNVTIKAHVTAPVLDTFAFELIGVLVIDSVFINGQPHSFLHQGDYGFIPLGSSLGQGDEIMAQVYYHGTPPTGGFFRGISTGYNSTYDKNVTWTLSEPYAAKEWFPVKQDLTDKADSVWVFVTTSPENMVGSQGLLTQVTNMPNGKVRYEWKSNYPIAYYLISISVADYQDYSIWAHPENMDDSLLIQNFIYDHPNYLNDWKEGIDQTAEFIELFSELYGQYPFAEEKYGHCVSQIGGGMEHQTMTTLGGFSFGLVAHELGHMWFGDNITCATWNDIWVNEGFATYSDYLAHSFLASSYYDSVWLKVRHDHVKSQPGGSVYVPDSLLGDVGRIFSGRLSYSKGALLLHMIRFELQDDELFFDIMTEFGVQYGDSVATGMDFKELVEDMSGQDFDDFFDQWYFGEGYPIFDIVWNQTDDTVHIYSTQTASTSATPFFSMLVPYYLKFSDNTDTTLLLYQDDPFSEYSIPMEKQVTTFRLDPDQWILHELNSLMVGIDNPANPVFFTIGPNPAQDRVHLFLRKDTCLNCTLKLSDLSGRILHTEDFLSGHHLLDLSEYPSGIYVITITDGLNSMTKRMMKVSNL